MFNYKGYGCEVCEKIFTEKDDIVVCPECGTPYHRSCYAEKGKCIHEAEHKSGYEFKKGPIMHDDCTAENPATMPCPQCSTINKSSNIFCQSCGQPLHTQHPQYTQPQNEAMSSMPFIAGLPPIDKDDEIDGIAVKDWMEYTGSSGPYYIFQFKSMDATKRKTSICWSAVFFPYFYFFFRKMWLCGIVAGLFALLTNVPSILLLLSQAGIISISISEALLLNLNMLSGILATMFNISCGIFAIYLYRQFAGNAIKRKRAQLQSKEEFSEWLKKVSGPSKIGLAIAIASLFLLSLIFVSALGPENVTNLAMLMYY